MTLILNYSTHNFHAQHWKIGAFCVSIVSLSVLSVCLSICPSVTYLTCKLSISVLLPNYLSHYPHVWDEGSFQKYAPKEGDESKVKVIKAISKIILLLGHGVSQISQTFFFYFSKFIPFKDDKFSVVQMIDSIPERVENIMVKGEFATRILSLTYNAPKGCLS